MTAPRLSAIVHALGLTPGKSVWLERDDEGWVIRGCVEGDQRLPRTKRCRTVTEALEAADGWLAPEVDAVTP